MNIVISKNTDSVYKDGSSFLGLGLSIPDDVNALYWRHNFGWVESSDGSIKGIEELPSWSNDCVAKFDAKVAEIEAQNLAAIKLSTILEAQP